MNLDNTVPPLRLGRKKKGLLESCCFFFRELSCLPLFLSYKACNRENLGALILQ
jgi:hypothetical protein